MTEITILYDTPHYSSFGCFETVVESVNEDFGLEINVRSEHSQVLDSIQSLPPDFIIIHLGGNNGEYALKLANECKKNYSGIIIGETTVTSRNPAPELFDEYWDGIRDQYLTLVDLLKKNGYVPDDIISRREKLFRHLERDDDSDI